MTMLLCWVAFPLILALLSAGAGLALERAAGCRMPTSLLVPSGFAAIVVITTALTWRSDTASLATAAVVIVAVLGFVLGVRGRAWPLANAGTAAVAAVFAVAAAPVVLSGEATFAGYTQLDDISTFLAFAAHAIDHGRDLSGLPPSTFETTLQINFRNDYPLGSLVPLSAAQPLVGEDLAWLWQPYLSFLLAVLALALWALAAPLVASRRLRAVVVFVAAQPALLFAYAQQGGVKELPMAALVATAAALVVELLRAWPRLAPLGRPRAALPLVVAVVALPCVLSAGALAYLGPLALAGLVAAVVHAYRSGVPARRLAAVVGGVAAVAALAGGVLFASTAAFRATGNGLLQNPDDIGNLFGPLDWKQLFGIWPAGDFRLPLGDGRALAYVLIAIAALAAVGGAASAVRQLAFGPLLFAAGTVGALVGLAAYGDSPWVDAKGLAIASPAVVLLALLGAAALLPGRRARLAGGAVLAAVAAGVVWSNWLAYRDVRLPPRERLAELQTIGERFAGQGPLLLNEYEPYGARYFLRRADPEAPAELRRRLIPVRTGKGLEKNTWAPLDAFLMPGLQTYRTIVVRRSPAESRPPANYALRWSGRYYDVFQRPEPSRSVVVEYSIFGDDLNAGALPPCDLVRRLAARARRERARLVAAVRAPAIVVDFGGASHPDWVVTDGPPKQLTPTADGGTARVVASVAAAGTYDLWLRGSFGRGIEVAVDGRTVGSVDGERSFAGQWVRVGAAELAAGGRVVALRYPGRSLGPGGGTEPEPFGPLALVPRRPASRLLDVPPDGVDRLCATPLDWLEVVRDG